LSITAAGWQKALLDGTFTPLRFHQPNFSQRVQSVFEGVFQRDPARRIASARAFLSELGARLEKSKRELQSCTSWVNSTPVPVAVSGKNRPAFFSPENAESLQRIVWK